MAAESCTATAGDEWHGGVGADEPAIITQSLAALPPGCLLSLQKSITQNKVSRLLQPSTITGSEYATLATITAEGLPTARTVWIRQLYQSRALLITTDSRSAKVSQLCRPHHLASIAYYLPLAKEQYRLTCQPTLLTHTTSHSTLAQLRSTVWQQSPDWLHDAFNQPPPGQPVGSSSGSGGGGGGGSSGVSEWFVVVLLWPIRCDYLRLPVTVIDNSKPLHRESRMKPQKEQQRWLHIRDAQTALWTITELNS